MGSLMSAALRATKRLSRMNPTLIPTSIPSSTVLLMRSDRRTSSVMPGWRAATRSSAGSTALVPKLCGAVMRTVPDRGLLVGARRSPQILEPLQCGAHLV